MISNQLPLRFTKAVRFWCGGAQETHWATCHNGVTHSKTKEFLKSPRFFKSLWYIIFKKIRISSLVAILCSLIDNWALKIEIFWSHIDY